MLDALCPESCVSLTFPPLFVKKKIRRLYSGFEFLTDKILQLIHEALSHSGSLFV